MNIEQQIREFLTGQSAKAYQVFGSHPVHKYGQDGIEFRVYAPNAVNMQLVGDFNDWNGWNMEHQTHGIWTIFCKDIPQGALYKYRTTTQEGRVIDRADPFAFHSELRPGNASAVFDVDHYHWNDENWMAQRNKNYTRPMSIYELHAGSWRRDTCLLYTSPSPRDS